MVKGWNISLWVKNMEWQVIVIKSFTSDWNIKKNTLCQGDLLQKCSIKQVIFKNFVFISFYKKLFLFKLLKNFLLQDFF